MISCSAFGTTIGVEIDDPVIGDRVGRLLQPLWSDRMPDTVLTLVDRVVRHDGSVLAELDSDLAAQSFLLAEVNVIMVSRLSTVAVHAGVVRWRGHGLLLVGDQGAGKSTLTAALVQDGAEYLTDEAAAFVDGRVVPYLKPLSLSVDSLRVLGLDPIPGDPTVKRHLRAEELGGSIGTLPMRVSAVIFPRFLSDAAPQATKIARSEAVLGLADETFRFAERPRASLEVLEAATRGARCLRLVTGPIDETLTCLRYALNDVG